MLNLRISWIIVISMVIYMCDSKIYEKCELAQELREKHFLPYEQIGTFVCIAERQSNLNTQALNSGLYFGMYQISGEYWCDTNYAGKACGVQCSKLLDDDLTDDLSCVQTIYDEHQRLFNNGFNAWPSAQYCQSQGNNSIQECFIKDNQIVKSYETVTRQYKAKSGSVGEGKVYERCELARELLNQHQFPMDQIATWVCIAKHESAFNTAAIGRLNSDGSEDHGLFQISDIYWCGETGKACGVQCPQMRDNDITDDVKCIKQIHAEHQRLFGDGFQAWAVYPRCKGQSSSYIDGCFDDSANEIKPYKPIPGIQQPKVHTQVQPTSQRKIPQTNAGKGKVYERCELARELLNRHQFPMDQIATWVCIAKHESAFNTAAIGRLNSDGSEDHGLFQISDIYWCGETGKACGVQCSQMRDNDITDDVKCIKQIYAEHQRLFGDGFQAWAVYPRCKGQLSSYIAGCFDDSANEIKPYKPIPGIKQPSIYAQQPPQRKIAKTNVGKGKVYERCELAQELRFKYKIPMEQVATWVCIAKHESAFNTSAIGRLNADGSEDHGLFQISDIYWCSPPGTGTACGIECSKLEDSDISDDVECMLKIHEEHLFLSGDGFNAWAVYRPHCQGRSSSFIDGCFNENDLLPKPVITQPYTTTTYRTTSRTTTTQRTTAPPTTTRRTTLPTTTTPRKTTSTTKRTTTRPPVTTTSRIIQTTTPRFYDTTLVYTTTAKTVVPFTTTRKALTTSTTKYSPPTFKAVSSEKPASIVTSTTRKVVPTTTKTSVKTTSRKVDHKITTTSLKPATFKSYQPAPITAKPASSFDVYFNSIPKGSSKAANPKNDINPSQKSGVFKSVPITTRTTSTRSTSKVPLTTVTSRRTYDQVNSGNAIIRQEVTTRRTTLGNPYSKPLTKSLARTSATTGKTTLVKNYKKDDTIAAKTTPRSIQKDVRQSSVSQSKSSGQSRSGARAATLKPFNLYDFYLRGDYSSKPSFVYKPIQFGDRSSVIIGKAGDDYSGNRIGRVAKNVTPYSIEHLLSLTTPRTTRNKP